MLIGNRAERGREGETEGKKMLVESRRKEEEKKGLTVR